MGIYQFVAVSVLVLNSFDYLTELLRHHRELGANPVLWMPWNYREQLPPADV